MGTGALTDDAFLDGRVVVQQPARGFRSGSDAVLLAAAVPAEPGQSVLELGCGVGVASLCLAARVSGLSLSALELQSEYADLARDNAHRNKMAVTIYAGDVADPPKALRGATFQQVFANPPYYRNSAHSSPDDAGRAMALGETATLKSWVDTATRRLAPRGYLTIIQKAGRLGDLLDACDHRLGSIEIKPISPRTGRLAELVILRARKGGRADLKLCAPLIMHDGTHHVSDKDNHSDIARRILRNGESLDF